MSNKAEERAFDAYPVDWDYGRNEGQFDWNEDSRKIYLEGYEQAEKDLALTWADIELIDKLLEDISREHYPYTLAAKDVYEEVIRRFNEQKK